MILKRLGTVRVGLVAAAIGFLCGAAAMALVWNSDRLADRLSADTLANDDGGSGIDARPARLDNPPPVAKPAPPPEHAPRFEGNPIEDLRQRRLQLPVRGATPDDLHDSFDETRGSNRRHEAIDMLSARNTPVLAVEHGTIAKLFNSKAGGITVYQFDPSATYVYYYAHLERYAEGLKEGDQVRRGQVIGYVGTSGNAPKDTPHLHFAIFKLTEKKQWWEGTPLDPYKVLR
jgi:murein DD-endopeptidase MepM/ murein hydrolase activator NlpD